MHTSTLTPTHTYTHTHTYIHTHAHTHTQAQSHTQSLNVFMDEEICVYIYMHIFKLFNVFSYVYGARKNEDGRKISGIYNCIRWHACAHTHGHKPTHLYTHRIPGSDCYFYGVFI